MIRPKARWSLVPNDPAVAGRLAERLKLHPVVAGLLVSRGILDEAEAERFLRPEYAQLHDPMRMKGMAEGVRRIREALDQGQKIRIYGDYDADGVSSTALMIHLFRRLNARFDYYIPNRFTEGYGLNEQAVALAKQEGVDLIVTVDNGISAVEPIAYAAQLGLDVIVTDHHEPPERLPDACALINPKQPDCPYPFKQLAGVGVAFKLAQALLARVPEELAELAAIGTVADIMPLVDENRVLVAEGLMRMRSSAYPGIRALLRIAGVDAREVSASHIGFSLGPRINASGRLEDAYPAVECLTADDDREADRLAGELDRLNKERQVMVERFTLDADRLMEQEGLQQDEVIVVAGEGWNVGVVGIVAAKLAEKHGRPAVVLSVDAELGLAKGSARSVPGFDLYAALTECAELLEHYGGHQAAAGMTLKRERVPDLRSRLCALARERLDPDYVPEMPVDGMCRVEDVSLPMIEQLQQLAPFGAGNEPPRFLFPALSVRELREMGKERQHLKLVLDGSGDGGNGLEAVAFRFGHLKPAISETSTLELLGELSVNEWNGRRKPQVIVHDLRVTRTQVFDWRGSGAADKLSDWLRLPGPEKTRAIVVFSAEHRREAESVLRKLDSRVPLWTVTDAGVPAALAGSDGDAAQRTWSDVTDVLLYSLPDRLDKAEILLRLGQRIESIYAVFAPGAATSDWPSRDSFKRAYAALLRIGQWPENDRAFAAKLGRHVGLGEPSVRLIIDVFLELGFMEAKDGVVRCVPSPDKKELTASDRYRAALAARECESALLYSTAADLTAWMLEKRRPSDQRMEDTG